MPEPEPFTARAQHAQDGHVVRLEWGGAGAGSLATYAAGRAAAVFAVVIDVLSFTTSVSVAADVGITVHPYRWGGAGADALATEQDAVLALPRSQARDGSISLSPGSIRSAQGVTSIVLPSPNGSAVTEVLAATGATVVAASLRNRKAVGAWLVERLVEAPARGTVVLLVPAGERWPDGSLRPAVEDLWGAGGVAAAVAEILEHRAGPLLLSSEAEAALAAFDAVRGRVGAALDTCASGRELVEAGWGDDVRIASELDSSVSVPVLVDGAYRSGGSLADGRPEG